MLITVFLGSVFAVIGIKETVRHYKGGHWIPTEATVLSCGVEESQSLNGGAPDFSIWLVYEYTYKSKKYSSPKSYLSHSSVFGVADAKRFLRESASGTRRIVWVSDQFPQQSTPEQHVWKGWAVSALFGIAIIYFSIYKML